MQQRTFLNAYISYPDKILGIYWYNQFGISWLLERFGFNPSSMACGHPKSPLYFGNVLGYKEQAGVYLQILFLRSHALNQKRNFPSFFHRRNLCTQCIDECSRLIEDCRLKWRRKLNCSHVKNLNWTCSHHRSEKMHQLSYWRTEGFPWSFTHLVSISASCWRLSLYSFSFLFSSSPWHHSKFLNLSHSE